MIQRSYDMSESIVLLIELDPINLTVRLGYGCCEWGASLRLFSAEFDYKM